MTKTHKLIKNAARTIAATGISLALGGAAMAADLGTYKGLAEPEMAPARKLDLSANVTLTTDYVFRGQSQSDEGPAIQGGFDATYGIFYVGVWASSIDFDAVTTPSGGVTDVADIEVDWYGGIKPKFRNIEFDLGIIYYQYPTAFDPGAELNYWEGKFGWSYTLFKDLGVSTTLFYSPEYTGEIGDNWVLETSLSKPLFRGLTLGATLGNQWGDDNKGGDDYTYWNVGISKDFHEKFTLDLRYWDTSSINGGCSGRQVFQCDERFVGSLTASF